jgi:CRP-like cAMP-binding protein
MPGSHDLQQNHLLAALSAAERERLYPHLQLVPMPLGKVLYESGDVLRHVYFPIDSIVSLLYVLADGASAEISVVGNEGLIGIALFMGGETTPSRAIVQSAGHAYRLIGQQLKKEFHRNGQMQLLLLRYTQALITQMAQTAVCNRHHSVDQQLCRWLLLSLDRLSSNQTMTQELIANMLGVRREGVTEAAGKLLKLGVIRYARGKITVLDRTKLERLCCECYAVVKQESDRLLPRPRPNPPRVSSSTEYPQRQQRQCVRRALKHAGQSLVSSTRRGAFPAHSLTPRVGGLAWPHPRHAAG